MVSEVGASNFIAAGTALRTGGGFRSTACDTPGRTIMPGKRIRIIFNRTAFKKERFSREIKARKLRWVETYKDKIML
jgi:hypothetical protein